MAYLENVFIVLAILNENKPKKIYIKDRFLVEHHVKIIF